MSGIHLIAVGKRMPDWVNAGYAEYAKRLPAQLKPQLCEIALGDRNKPLAQAIASEGQAMLQAIPARSHIIALDVKGKSWSTEQLASQLQHWQREYGTISFLIGGPDGLAPECSNAAATRWSLSALTLPHPLVRLLWIEQIYRAWSINQGHPYHK